MARRVDTQPEPLTLPTPAVTAERRYDHPVHPAVWLAFNALCAAGVVLPALSAAPPALVFGWLICLSLNLLGAAFVLHWRVPDERAALSQGLAAVLGVVWGVGVGLIGATLALPALFVLLIAGSAAIGATVPMMALAAPSWIALMAGFFAPTTWLLANRDPGLAAAWGGLVLPLFVLFARRQQELAAELSDLRREISRLHVRARGHGLAVPVDPQDPAAVRGQLAALAQALDDHAHATSTLTAITDALVRVDRGGRVVYLNRAAERLTRRRYASALGRPVQEVLDLAAQDEDKLTAHLIEQCFATGRAQQGPAHSWLRRQDGRVLAVECSVAPVDDAQHRLDGLVFSLRDVTAAREEGQVLAWCATHDGLTSLADRTRFEAQIANLAAAAEDLAHHAVCILDLDDFDELNELYGLPAGDRVLRELASVLREEVAAPHLLARTGEDEFGVCLENHTLERATAAADALRAAIERHRVPWQHGWIGVRASAGVAEISSRDAAQRSALTRARLACTLAKRAGGNRVRALTEDGGGRIESDGGVDPRALRAALERNRIAFAIAPTRPLDDRIVQPGYAELVPQLEGEATHVGDKLRTAQTRLATELDRRRVAAAVAALRADRSFLSADDILAVDVSAASLADERYAAYVLDLLAGGTPVAHRLAFEIPATVPAEEIEGCAAFAEILRQRGCHVTLDGYGADGLSFQLLKRLRPDYVKIDEGFVRRLGASAVDYEIVLGLSRVARTMNVKIVADGVGTLAARELLSRMGVDFLQGPLAGPTRPIPMSAA
ncbi:MAG TPA: EAL domain-containing protein [Gammaproteobacteria bacterium]|nr:EAL domain-containing protein [Gammaproteobacteria bacterium]